MQEVQFWRHEPQDQNADVFDTAFLHFLAGIVPKLTSKDLSKATGIMMPRGATLPPCPVSAGTLYLHWGRY